MTLIRKFWCQSALLALLPMGGFAQATERLAVIHRPNASELEVEAAEDLSKKLRQLFPQSQVEVGSNVETTTGQAILIGNPQTNPRIRDMKGLTWPQLSDQGFIIRSVKGKTNTLVIGGNTPVATWWAVHEFTHRLGFRHYLHGDERPVVVPTLPLTMDDATSEPKVTDRGWQTWGSSPLGWQSWSLTEHAAAIRQLSKLKFNRIILEVAPWHPFVSYEFGGVRSHTAVLWRGEKFALDGDLAGKKAFPHGQTVFSNSDFNAIPSYDEMMLAGRRYMQGLQDIAQKYQMKLAVHLTAHEVGREFPEKFLVSRPTTNDLLARLQKSADAVPLLDGLSKSYRSQYPGISEITWSTAEFQPGQPWEVQYVRGVAASDATKISNGDRSPLDRLAVPKPTANSRLLIGALGSSSGFLPQTYVATLPSNFKNATSLGWNAVSTTASTPFEADWPVADVARSLWDSASDVKSMFVANWVALTGKQAAAERLWLAEEKVQQAEANIAKHDPQFGNIDPEMLMRHFQNEPAPEWWQELTAAYDAYLTESYRAHGAVEGRAKDLLYYRAKRGEFAFEYMNAIVALRDAAIQHGAGDLAASEEAMGTALESLYNAITHLSDAARDSSDRALIAVLNAYAYRPLQAASDKLSN